MKAPSLRGRLLGLLLAAIAAVWLASGLVAYFDARHEAHELLDGHLAQSASLLLVQTGGKSGKIRGRDAKDKDKDKDEDEEEIDTEHVPALHRYSRKTAFQVWEQGRVLRLHSANAPGPRLSPEERGFSDVTYAEARWRVFSAWDEKHRVLVQVAERIESRDEIAGAIAKSLGLWLLAALPLLALGIWLAVARALRPIEALGAQVAARDPKHLEPLRSPDAPAELRPMLDALNRLFGRIRELLERERRFTADAAHELRTPIAALRTQAQLALSARQDGVRDEALRSVLTGSDRAARLIEQLLALERLESNAVDAAREAVDLQAIARDAVAQYAPAAIAKNIEIGVDESALAGVFGYPGLLAILARNLVDNAVRYTPSGGRVDVAVLAGDNPGRVCLAVSDSGPGVPADEMPRLGERFHRVLGNEASGSGLGLSIVSRIAQLHGAQVRYATGKDGRGLCVAVEFDAHTPPAGA